MTDRKMAGKRQRSFDKLRMTNSGGRPESMRKRKRKSTLQRRRTAGYLNGRHPALQTAKAGLRFEGWGIY
jgi:hypothetical protein